LTSDHAIAQRIRNKVRYLGDPGYVGEYTRVQQLGVVMRLLVRGVLRGGPGRVYHFLRTLPVRSPRAFPLVVVDWIGGLAMQDYVRRHFDIAGEHAVTLARRFDAVRTALARCLDEGRAALSIKHSGGAGLFLSLRAVIDRKSLVRTGRQLAALLEQTPATVTVRFGSGLDWDVESAKRFLRRLARYGDRISIVADERLRRLVAIDWSRFNMILEDAAGSELQ
jgi:hypothetical protein